MCSRCHWGFIFSDLSLPSDYKIRTITLTDERNSATTCTLTSRACEEQLKRGWTGSGPAESDPSAGRPWGPTTSQWAGRPGDRGELELPWGGHHQGSGLTPAGASLLFQHVNLASRGTSPLSQVTHPVLNNTFFYTLRKLDNRSPFHILKSSKAQKQCRSPSTEAHLAHHRRAA